MYFKVVSSPRLLDHQYSSYTFVSEYQFIDSTNWFIELDFSMDDTYSLKEILGILMPCSTDIFSITDASDKKIPVRKTKLFVDLEENPIILLTSKMFKDTKISGPIYLTIDSTYKEIPPYFFYIGFEGYSNSNSYINNLRDYNNRGFYKTEHISRNESNGNIKSYLSGLIVSSHNKPISDAKVQHLHTYNLGNSGMIHIVTDTIITYSDHNGIFNFPIDCWAGNYKDGRSLSIYNPNTNKIEIIKTELLSTAPYNTTDLGTFTLTGGVSNSNNISNLYHSSIYNVKHIHSASDQRMTLKFNTKNSSKDNIMVKIFTPNGRNIASQQIARSINNDYFVEFNSIVQGIYIVRIINGPNQLSLKIKL